MSEGRLTLEEEAACVAALSGAEALAYVCCKLYLFVPDAAAAAAAAADHDATADDPAASPLPAAWEDTGLVGPLFLTRQCGVYYFSLVELASCELKMVHELHFPFELQVLNERFYCFESPLFKAVVGIKACEGGTTELLAAVSLLIRDQCARSLLTTNPGSAFDGTSSAVPPRSESAAEAARTPDERRRLRGSRRAAAEAAAAAAAASADAPGAAGSAQ
eukprot:Rhum_TRINITY_DN14618_c19_g1::Rhum_TRINITY_DN14618_c19_g1_i1::g.106023::m.106023